MMLSMGAHLGVHGLQHAGLCPARAWGSSDIPVYQKLAFWIQPSDFRSIANRQSQMRYT